MLPPDRTLRRRLWNQLHASHPEALGVPDRIVADAVKGSRPGRALDLGCGSGELAVRLAQHGWNVTGVDWSLTAIERARAAADALGLRITFTLADMTAWHSGARFDLVTCTYALPGRGAAPAALAAASRALAPDGLLLVAEWDQSMATPWNLEEADLFTPELIAGWLPDLHVEQACVRGIDGVFSRDDPVNVAWVRARNTKQVLP